MKSLKQQNKMHEHHDEESLVPCTMYDQLFTMLLHCNKQRNNKKYNTAMIQVKFGCVATTKTNNIAQCS
jgi:hypothetical protein